MTDKFVLHLEGLTEAKIISRPSIRIKENAISDIIIFRENKIAYAHTPSLSCDGLSNGGSDVFVVCCPLDDDDDKTLTPYHDKITHTVFLAYFKETSKNVQIMGINYNLSMEIMESCIEKNLMSILPPVKQFTRNTHMKLEDRIDSVFSFTGICEDGTHFVMEVCNVPHAEYNHGQPDAFKHAIIANRLDMTEEDYNTKSAYFPERDATNTAELVKKVQDLTTISNDSSILCIIGFVVQRTDINKLELSLYNDDYRLAVKKALEHGVRVMHIVINWTSCGDAYFVTDELPVVNPI
jgi:hypothetical protein